MSTLRVVVVPVGRVDAGEVESACQRAHRVLERPIELREACPLPLDGEDAGRQQHDSHLLLIALRRRIPRLRVASLVGATVQGTPVPTPDPDAVIYVTDIDMFKAQKESVFGEMDRKRGDAVISLRRLREAFYRRPPDRARQSARLTKQILRCVGMIRRLPNCGDPTCVMASARSVADIDRKHERFCPACRRHLKAGTVGL